MLVRHRQLKRFFGEAKLDLYAQRHYCEQQYLTVQYTEGLL